ncbi:hypothetical protein TNCV_1440231 [Trichonephila clavipes]|nr:hypothetical protein TNCV_1440231 [Trichonephila clavipes]
MSDKKNCLNIIQCRTKTAEAKKESKLSQTEVPLTLGGAKIIITTYIDKCTTTTKKTKNIGKPCETLITVGTIPRHMERADAVALFHLTTGHEPLVVYLN